jgi:hypothetical protein
LETELITEVRKRVAHSLKVPEERIRCTLDGDVLVVTVTGELRGRSVRNATRRRQRALGLAKRIAANSDLRVSFTFAVRDAIATIEDLVRTNTSFALGRNPEAVHIDIKKAGQTTVVVAMPGIEDGAESRLKSIIAPLLHSSGLSLASLSLVSPSREDVTDARLLRAAKILSPCDGAAVARRLKENERIDIAADLVHRRLDILRQKGLLVYLGDRRFALTLKGLASVPTSTRRNSSDIERALALARSKW